MGRSKRKAYEEYTVTMLKTGNTSELEDLNLYIVRLNVYSTNLACLSVQTRHIACGGHGYSALSGFGRKYAHTVNAVTYEGDNYVIGQQVTRAILKDYRRNSTSVPRASLTWNCVNQDAKLES
ncbi:uncharacterized protein Z519_12211 [Cladophialophora bantiana CBS 173.52]|uniref:Acyl-CoA oxidase C-alpha1 domain-containing protein n=1 Tax=Cladophialophora bantiana (strain ATCC 10958 / CBS 173.52 / CDC B-1940 / NIH 8579) TaxID=1442370 RepID=A0A0D2H8A5_CLAB1|nr:uncharacterized protein Z519_12211 [Cladophialophora bantiana CBS 173.52]KIW87100.1 hypothetical protein Z519_12211 [Cladophialophora bantiana CBS 173.52]